MNTGRMRAEDAASSIGMDISSKEFWMSGINFISLYVERLARWL